MKSRKLRAVFAAMSAIAVLSTAMTGFAAVTVNTTTKYNTGNDYVYVTSEVTGAKGDVTYLATTSDGMGVDETGILYIDQKEAAEDGSVTFDYVVERDIIDGMNTKVTLGTNSTEKIIQPTTGLGIRPGSYVNREGYDIEYITEYFAKGDDSVIAVITPDHGYEIVSVTINGEAKDNDLASYIVPIVDGVVASIEVDAVKSETDLAMTSTDIYSDDGCTVTTIFKPTGNWSEVGVAYYDYEFPAEGNVNNKGYVAVQLTDDKPINAGKYSKFIR